MGYSSKVAHKASIANQNQGGGNSKPGLFPQVGRSSWTSVAYNANGIPSGQCCKQTDMRRLNFTHYTKPTGTTIHVPYFN